MTLANLLRANWQAISSKTGVTEAELDRAEMRERRSTRWDSDPESARDALSAAVSLVLRLLGRDPDPAKSREHVLLSVLAEQRLSRDEPAPLGLLLDVAYAINERMMRKSY